MDKVIKVFHSFEEADKADDEYYMLLTPQERLKICFQIRTQHFALHQIDPDDYKLRKLRTMKVQSFPVN